jgi:Na+-driven multidrug efflux pump
VGTYFFNFLSLVTTSRVAHALVARDERAAQRAVGDGVAVATVRHTQASARHRDAEA